MTGYLERLLARTAGPGPTTAMPRVSFRFEGDLDPTDRVTTGAGVDDPTTYVGSDGRAVLLTDSRADAPGQPAHEPGRDVPAASTGRPRSSDLETPSATRLPPRSVVDASLRPAPATQQEPIEAVLEAVARPDAEPAGPGAAIAASPDPWPVVAATPALPVAPPEPSTGASRADGPVPDVIHVTIDRVEVRATVPAPPAGTTSRPGGRPAAPSLTLQDYLRGSREAR